MIYSALASLGRLFFGQNYSNFNNQYRNIYYTLTYNILMQGFQLGEYFGTNSLARVADLYEVMTEVRFSAKDTEIQYRHINHWDENDLLSINRGEIAGSWRRFNFVQFIWIRLIEEMRNLSVPIPTIQKIKKSLFEQITFRELFQFLNENLSEIKDMKIEEPEKSELLGFIKKGDFSMFPKEAGIPYLQLILSEVICDRLPISLLIFSDGYWLPFNETSSYQYSTEDNIRIANQGCFKIPLAGVLARFIAGFYEDEICVTTKLITEKERLTLADIEDKKIITIITKQKAAESRCEISNKPFSEVVDFLLYNKMIGNKIKYEYMK